MIISILIHIVIIIIDSLIINISTKQTWLGCQAQEVHEEADGQAPPAGRTIYIVVMTNLLLLLLLLLIITIMIIKILILILILLIILILTVNIVIHIDNDSSTNSNTHSNP